MIGLRRHRLGNGRGRMILAARRLARKTGNAPCPPGIRHAIVRRRHRLPTVQLATAGSRLTADPGSVESLGQDARHVRA